MINDITLSFQNMDNINIEETKKNIFSYFMYFDKLRWEWNKLNIQKGMTANYDFAVEYKNQPYIPIGKDEFNLSAREYKEEELKKYISNYYWAINLLSEEEQIFINTYFKNKKSEEETAELLELTRDIMEFKKIKRSAIYKFADFLNLLVEKNRR